MIKLNLNYQCPEPEQKPEDDDPLPGGPDID